MAKFWTSFKRAYRRRVLGAVAKGRSTEAVKFLDALGNERDVFCWDSQIRVGEIVLYRHQVEALINHLESWLDYGTLEVRR